MNKIITRYENIIEQIDKDLSIQLLKIAPLNMNAEKKKFFSIKDYEPIFKYKKVKISNNTLLNFEKLRSIYLPNDSISEALLQKAKLLEKYAELVSSIGTSHFSKISEQIYGKPTPNLIREAKKILKTKHSDKIEYVDSAKALAIAKKCISSFKLTGWKAKYAPIVSLAMVHSSTKTILVRKNVQVPVNFLKRMIVHEVGTHVFRSWNGRHQPYKIFSGGFAKYLETEEGLATNVEEMYGCLDQKTLNIYAARVLAADVSVHNGFRKTYDEIRKYLNENDAWQVTLRVKRGMSITKYPGSYSKDHLYLKGYFSVKKYLSKKKKTGLKNLFYGKLSLADSHIISQTKGLVKPHLLPTDKKIQVLLRKI